MLLTSSSSAWAQIDHSLLELPSSSRPRVPFSQLDFLATPHFSFKARALLSGAGRLVARPSAWSLEGRLFAPATDDLTLAITLPLGLYDPGVPELRRAFFGNAAIGMVSGRQLQLPLSSGATTRLPVDVGGSFELYVPSAPRRRPGPLNTTMTLMAAMRGYDVQLYLPRMFSARFRGFAAARFEALRVSAELSLVPGTTVGSGSGGTLFVGGSAWAGYEVTQNVVPFVEISGAVEAIGATDVEAPFTITPGVRLHVANAFDPALFVSLNFARDRVIVLGVDLARASRENEWFARRQSFDDGFLDF